jgi:hypothetical protein
MGARMRNRGLRVGVAGLLAMAFLGPSAKASAVTTANAIDTLQTVGCPSGIVILPAASSVTDDGWIRLEYDIDGVPNIREIPPAGFRSQEASDLVLSQHHLPARPAAGEDAAEWASFVDGLAAVRTQGICRSKVTSVGSQRYGNNWGGDEVRYQSNYGFNGVKANFIQASVGTACNSLGDVSEWVGLGGDVNEAGGTSLSLVQAGTNAWGSAWNGIFPAQYYFMYDWLDPQNAFRNSVAVTDIAVRPGDSIGAEVDETSTGFFTVYLSNWTLGLSYYTTITDAGSHDPSSAEWIDERNWTDLLGFGYLTNYSTPGYPLWTSWSQMKTHHTNDTWASPWIAAYSEPTEWWIMMTSDGMPYPRNGNVELSQTTGTYSDSHMKDHWHAGGC